MRKGQRTARGEDALATDEHGQTLERTKPTLFHCLVEEGSRGLARMNSDSRWAAFHIGGSSAFIRGSLPTVHPPTKTAFAFADPRAESLRPFA